MTDLKIKDIRNKFGKKIAIWGGLPSIVTLKDSFSDERFERYIEDFFDDIGDGKRLIISFADTTPPDADFDRILKIAKLSKYFSS
jgi:hypothetical protein